MKMNLRKKRRVTTANLAFLQIDLAVALAILAIAIVPLGFSFARERQVLKVEYQHAVINELVDGEMEILAAGAAKNLADGKQILPVNSDALEEIPAGQFELTKSKKYLRLEWLPVKTHNFSPVIRGVSLP